MKEIKYFYVGYGLFFNQIDKKKDCIVNKVIYVGGKLIKNVVKNS
ncbi:MAG: hypothetical protein ACK5XN_33585 [Bacteroidota bacterium]